ncbi:alpha/beta fold hydrolase [Geothrix sp. PMB-07]|uniref:alpha/beta fold hydrolase n=1 Tax=Geothrix sp. PMB-07 TaxID=3068640 RepID=UPI0027419948|nr:alpha/beta hydrolase [Geothrix sp. PMB-07]WLT31897.1 alpha/beta hydrolase [Geothrix sp. PMB-07]
MSTWILLRGLTRESRHWGDFPGQLQAALPLARILAVDLPGNGTFHQEASPLTVQGMVAHARAQLVELGAAPPFHLLALSMGAMVATAWAEAFPGEVAGCVLINTSFRGFSPPHRRLRPRAWPSLLRMPLTPSAEGRERLLFSLTSRREAGPVPPWKAWVEIRRSRPGHLRNALRQLLAAARFKAPAQAPAPTLVLTSAGDGLVASRCSLDISRRWACALAIHPWAGHDLTLDDGAWVAHQIRQWLNAGAG